MAPSTTLSRTKACISGSSTARPAALRVARHARRTGHLACLVGALLCGFSACREQVRGPSLGAEAGAGGLPTAGAGGSEPGTSVGHAASGAEGGESAGG